MKLQRQAHIRQIVSERQRISVTELSRLLRVSEATIRRDLDELDGGDLQRTHGGIVARDGATSELPIFQRLNDHSDLKKRIALAAAAMVKEGQTIFISSGSTALEVARALPSGVRLTVISNSLPVINTLVGKSSIDLIAIGGLIRHEEMSMIGHTAEQSLREFRADLAFIGMRAVHPKRGFTNDYLPEILTDRSILQIASQVVVVADHTKFGRIYSVFVAPVTAAHTIITDDGIRPESLAELQSLGIEVLAV